MTQITVAVLSGPMTQEPLLLKINLSTGQSSTSTGESDESPPRLEVQQQDGEGSSNGSRSGSVQSSRPSSSLSQPLGKSEETSRPQSREAPLNGGLLHVSLPTHTNKSRKRKNLTQATVDDEINKHILQLQQQEVDRMERLEERKKAAPEMDYIDEIAAVTRQKEVALVDLSDDEEATPSTSRDFEIIDVSSGEDDDGNSRSSGSRRVAPTYSFSFGDGRRVKGLTAHERKQRNTAQEVEKNRLRGKNFDLLDANLGPGADGRLLVNAGHPPSDPPIYVAAHLSHVLQPHQLGGVRFMYDNVVESVQAYRANGPTGGYGCILAHSMGLGKTLQVITMTDVFFRATQAHKVLVIMPINTIQNWWNEFNRWMPKFDLEGKEMRSWDVFLFGDAVKSFDQRVTLLEQWHSRGGVLLIGYDMYRQLVNNARPREKEMTKAQRLKAEGKVKRPKKVESMEGTTPEGRQRKEAHDLVYAALVEPGAELVVCDEGHKIKSQNAEISLTLGAMATRRRIVLTGYPLQNNLMEYYCMVNFVRPDYLGPRKSFADQFEKPIKNGQCVDSNASDVRLARLRTVVLQQLLRGFVQRRTQHLLKKILPESREYVVLVRKSPIQHLLYRAFIANAFDEFRSGTSNTLNPLEAFAICSKIWNHPDVLFRSLRQLRQLKEKLRQEKQSVVMNGNYGGFSAFPPLHNGHFYNNNEDMDGSRGRQRNQPTLASMLAGELDLDPNVKYDWAEMALHGYVEGEAANSFKMLVALQIIDAAAALGEKILLFSQNLTALSVLEDFLAVRTLRSPQGNRPWTKNVNYYRFDGSTSGSERERLINKFNSDSEVFLFLISTRAGSLGVNLVSASRCIILDACWNPCHDAQAVCRIYRYGQQRKTFIYRLIMDNSMEKAIFNRQISKNGLQKRVVDEHFVEANVTMSELESLLEYDENLDVISSDHNISTWAIEDSVLQQVVQQNPKLLSQEPFLHESLLTEREEMLSEQERSEAIALYEKEKADEGLAQREQERGVFPSSRPFYNQQYTSHNSPYVNPFPGGYAPPPMRATPLLPFTLATRDLMMPPGGMTMNAMMRMRDNGAEGQRRTMQMPPVLVPPPYIGRRYDVILDQDYTVPAVGTGEGVRLPQGTRATFLDNGPSHRQLFVIGQRALDARGLDMSRMIAPRPPAVIDVIDLD